MYKWWSWQAGRDDLEEEVCGWHLAAYPPILHPNSLYTTAFDICIGIYFLLPMFMVLHGLYIYIIII